MQKHDVVVRNQHGLHARAAARVTQIASGFSASIVLMANGKRANAKSLLAVMILAASVGTRISIETRGSDEVEAMQAVARLIDGRLGEPL